MPDEAAFEVSVRADALNAFGAQQHHAGRIDVARMHYLAALMHDPKHPLALQNLGAALLHMEKFEAAASVSRRSLAILPDNPHAMANLAVALLGLRRYGEARRLFEKSFDKHNDKAPLLHNYGLLLYMTGKLTEALEVYNRARKLAPGIDAVESDRALTLLALGKLQEGLEAYEVRWKTLFRSKVWELGIKEWQGEPLEDKSILLHSEQGFGDSLMLARFIKDVVAKGAEVTLATPGVLVKLFQQNLSEVKVVDWTDDLDADEFDFHSPLLSVPRWLGLEVKDIKSEPYLTAQPKDWGIALPKAKLRIGICWASGDHGPALSRRRRLVPLVKFLPFTELDGVKVFSLQVGEASKEIVNLGAEGIFFDCTAKIDDFADTAALISELDLVISVDSAVIHLAGAMGKPTIMLSPYTRCWRWWGMNGVNWTGRPWYENMSIVRQDMDGAWHAAMLQALSSAKRRLKAL